MSGGTRLLVGAAAIGLVISALGIATPESSDLNGQPSVSLEVPVNR